MKRNRKKRSSAVGIIMAIVLVILIVIVALLTLAGKKRKDAKEQPTSIEETVTTTAEAETEEGEVDFLDAHGDLYKMFIDPEVSPHPYDVSLFSNDGTICSYEDDNYTSRRGIDISSFQGDIDWQAVADSGIEFVFLRLGYRGYGPEGSLHEDEKFSEYITGAQAAGLDVGAYFFSQAVNEAEAIEEAEFCIDVLWPYELQLPMVFDAENINHDVARTDNVSGEQFTKNAVAFCERILQEGYYQTAIYSNLKWEAFVYDLEALKNYQIWYADYEKRPQTPYNFTWWQYSEKGSVPGISGKVDLDIEILEK